MKLSTIFVRYADGEKAGPYAEELYARSSALHDLRPWTLETWMLEAVSDGKGGWRFSEGDVQAVLRAAPPPNA